jgi:curved DNA-binding protein
MATPPDYYSALGIPHDANLDQIKKAYRKLARQYHPDMSKASDSEARFKEAAEAYATLKNPEKRAAYDELLANPPTHMPSSSAQRHNAAGSQDSPFANMDFEDILASMGHGPQRARNKQAPAAGRDFEDTVHIDVVQAHTGTILNLDLTGGVITRSLEVKIPAGVVEGQKIRLRGMGGDGLRGGPKGDMYLHIQLKPHPAWRVDKHDLYFELLLSPWEAVLGADITVATPDGAKVLTVPAGTHSGSKLRLRRCGLATATGGRGDLYANAHIEVPIHPSAHELGLFKELAQSSTFSPRSPSTHTA